MDEASHGYDVSVGYAYGFYPEMAPDWLDLCARVAGYRPPERGPAQRFRYLDLGSGQGMGLCLLAAANPQADFLGVDLQPEHIEHARGLAQAAGLTNVRFEEADFVELAAAWPEDFGAFDYVVLHGIYSWISPKVREAVVQCLQHATGSGGLVYVGYNAQPGWLSTVPFQHITRLIKETTGKPGGEVLGESIALFDRLRAGGAATFNILPALKARLDAVKGRSHNYLIAEYLNENWRPRWHSEVVKELAQADLDYVGTATLAETMLPGLLPPPLRDTILAQPDASLRSDLQDFVINQSFRRDIFCRNPHRIAPGEGLAQTPLHLLSRPAPGRGLDIKTAFGEMTLQPQAFTEIVDALATGPKPIADLAQLPSLRKQGPQNALQLLYLLLASGTLAVGTAEPVEADVAQRLNHVIAREAARGMPYGHIAVFALGSAIAASDVELTLLDAWLTSSGQADAAALANGVEDRLTTLGPEQLMASANIFLDQTLPQWKALGGLS